MFRYVILKWTSASADHARTVGAMKALLMQSDTPWRCAWARAGIEVFCTGEAEGASSVVPLHDTSGVVLGTVFSNLEPGTPASRIHGFDAGVTKRILATRGRALVTGYWGRYVLVTEVERDLLILRSPSGELDCLTLSVGGVEVFFSDAGDCPALDLATLSIDWEFVASDIAMTLPYSRRTGLREVTRLLPGECWRIGSRGCERTSYWDPTEFISAGWRDDFESACRSLRDVVRSSILAWASCHRGVTTLLSGGLDSSIIASVLRDVPADTRRVALNYRNPFDPATDERAFARLVAAHAGHTLIEHEQTAAFSLEPILETRRSAIPYCTMFEVENSRIERSIGRQYGVTASFLGEGGDQLFFQNGADFLCGDYVFDRGLRPGLFGVAMAAARMEGTSVWQRLRGGLATRPRREPLEYVLERQRVTALLTKDARDAVEKARLFVSPSLETGRRIPPGKIWQVCGLSLPHESHSPFATPTDPERVFPLLSQPIQELCLRIPTYMLTHGARDRGLARVAFRPDVPEQVLGRRAKSFVADFPKAIMAHNLSFLRSLLHEGQLVREGIVPPAILEKTLSGDLSSGLGLPVDVVRLATTEAWIRQWREHAIRRAA